MWFWNLYLRADLDSNHVLKTLLIKLYMIHSSTKNGEFRLSGLQMHTEEFFSFYLSYDKPYGKLTLGEDDIKVITDRRG